MTKEAIRKVVEEALNISAVEDALVKILSNEPPSGVRGFSP